MKLKAALPLIALAASACAHAQNPAPAAPADTSFRDRAPSEEIVYFVLPDRFEK